jgi:hypothetical protein
LRAGKLVAVGQGLQESDEIILLLTRQLEISELFLIEVAGIFRLRPAFYLFAGISCLALR